VERGVESARNGGRRARNEEGRAMVAAYHLIWTAYGWWLPNDPRGSSSHEIRVERIRDLGELHHGRKAVQPSSAEIGAFYEEARQALKHELLTLDERARLVVAASLAVIIHQRGSVTPAPSCPTTFTSCSGGTPTGPKR